MAGIATTNEEKIKPELHLFIMWPLAGNSLKIQGHITSLFDVIRECEIVLLKETMAEFLANFYGMKLPSIKAKLGHTGDGPIRYLIVKDNTPKYGTRNYHGKMTLVNTRTFDSRLTCRNLSGDPDTIHGTINAREIYHDLPLLLGEDGHSPEDFFQRPILHSSPL